MLDPLSGPRVLHYCGHRVGGQRFPSPDEAHVTAQIAHEVERLGPGYGYGALANGGDIICAEELLRRGAELHVVLPFAREEFVRTSVADSGEDWADRFDTCMAAAASVTYATDDAFLGEDVLFRDGTELAMGMALERAAWLDAPAEQLAVWDGMPTGGASFLPAAPAAASAFFSFFLTTLSLLRRILRNTSSLTTKYQSPKRRFKSFTFSWPFFTSAW